MIAYLSLTVYVCSLENWAGGRGGGGGGGRGGGGGGGGGGRGGGGAGNRACTGIIVAQLC